MKIEDLKLSKKKYTEEELEEIIEYIMSIVDSEISKPNYTYTDKNGNIGKMNTVSFNELIFRSTLEKYDFIFVTGYLTKLLNNDLVIINSFPDCSVACSTDQGQIRSANGLTPGVKTIQESIETGLFHYGNYGPCRHRATLYIEGRTILPEIYSEEIMSVQRDITKKKRAVERTIRKYKALGNEMKVKEWSKRPHDKNRVW